MSRPILKLGHRVPNRNHPLNQGKVAWLLSPNGEASYIPDLIGTSDIRFNGASGLRVGGPVLNRFVGPAYRITAGSLQSGNGLSPLISNLNNGPYGFSVSFWVMIFANNTHILSKGTRDVNSTGTGFFCGVDGSTRVTLDIGSNNSMTYRTPTLSMSRWYHIIWTWRNRNNCAGFVDGISQSLSSLLVGTAFNAEGLSRLNVLTRSDGTNAGNVWIHDIQLWNRCLGSQEARQVFVEASEGYQNCLLTIPDDGQESQAIHEKSVTSTLTLSQTIDCVHIVSKDVTSTLSMTSTVSLGLLDEQEVDQTLTVSQDIDLQIIVNPIVNQTLTFTQDIDVIKEGFQLTSNTLNLTQDIDVNIVSNQEVESTLTLDQDINIIWFVEHELTFTQDIDFEKFKFEIVTSTLTFTQSVTNLKVINKTVNSNINLYHLVFVNKTLSKSVNSNVNFTQTVVGNASRSVINTLTFTQTIDVVKAKRVTSSLEYTQSIFVDLTINRTVLHNFNPYQQIARRLLSNQSVQSTLNLTQTVVAHKVKEVRQTLNLTQTVDVVASKYVQSDLEFTETITFNQIRNLELFQLCFFIQTVTVDKVLSRSVPPSVLAFDQTIVVRKVHNVSVTSTLTLSHNIVRERFAKSVSSTLTFTQTIAQDRVINLSVSQSLTLSQTVSLSKILTRNVTNTLVFLPYHTKPLGGIDIIFPTIIVGKSQRFTLLKALGRAITLPNPIFGDGEGNTGIFTLRRGMRGKSYTYVKTTDFRKLAYTFHIPRVKAYELIDFVSACNSNVIEIENWKGEIWRVLLANNPTDFASLERYASEKEFDDQREKVEVRMEFEGFRLV